MAYFLPSSTIKTPVIAGDIVPIEWMKCNCLDMMMIVGAWEAGPPVLVPVLVFSGYESGQTTLVMQSTFFAPTLMSLRAGRKSLNSYDEIKFCEVSIRV